MLTVDEATQLVNEQTSALPPVRVRLREARGLVLAGEVVSDIDSPPHNKAMMDGFAVVAGDASETRSILESVMAGDVPRHAVRPGTAARVMTGAPVPDGATAVVPVEQTELVDEATVRLATPRMQLGKHLMRQGTAMQAGQRVATAGTPIDSVLMAILAEAGAAVVEVYPRPSVAVLATGNELVTVDEVPGPGQIRNSNGPMLGAAVLEAGCAMHELPTGRDDLDQLTDLVRQGLDADVLLATGGVSAGDMDLVPAALATAGVEQVLHKVALKPGKPLWFGVAPRDATLGDGGPPRLVFGLPGNPVSSLVCFHLFVRPVLAVLAGRAPRVERTLLGGTIAERYEHRGGRETFRPAQVDRQQAVSFGDWHGSADLAGLASANCLVHLPSHPLTLSAGDAVAYLPLDRCCQ